VETPDGAYPLEADWVIAADGVRSTIRRLLGLTFSGVAFEEKFLIADVRMAAALPTERRFWFSPTFHSGGSALMHRQPGNIWRIDLPLGVNADIGEEQKPERVIARLKRMLGERDFSLAWTSIYRFDCRRLDRFVHGRVIFAGDAAHQVSPFGARGGNSGVQDAENIAWKLAATIKGEASESLIESYDFERTQAADENIRHATRSTDFITPRSDAERTLRNAVLALARQAEFARRMVNSGRLSTATRYASPLSTEDEDEFAGSASLGAPAPDVPLSDADGHRGFLLERLPHGFALLHVSDRDLPVAPPGLTTLVVGRDLFDESGAFAQRFDATPGAAYLLRPDHHLCARWRRYDAAKVASAMRRALGH
jgi:3-(3-hydroxy-phenyl)propionate hydroxylase